MVSGIMVVMVLLIPVPSFLNIFHTVLGAFRIWLRLKLCGKIADPRTVFCAHTCACMISLWKLMILAPTVRQRLTLRVTCISIHVSSFVLISILIMRAVTVVNFAVLQRETLTASFFVSFIRSESKNIECI